MEKTLSILVAYSKNRVIGAQGKIPWNLASERDRFKQICSGKKIIMGRKSFEEIGHALPYCTIIVLSKSLTKAPQGCLLARTLEEAVSMAGENSESGAGSEGNAEGAKGETEREGDGAGGASSMGGSSNTQYGEILIAGGEELYRQTLPQATKIYATEISADFTGDRFFPALDGRWHRTLIEKREENGVEYEYVMYERKR